MRNDVTCAKMQIFFPSAQEGTNVL